MKTKTKQMSFISLVIFILTSVFSGIYIYKSINIVNAAWVSPSYTLYSIKCIKDGFGNYTGSGYLDIEFRSSPDATYKRRYLLDRPGRITAIPFINSRWGNDVNACPNFVAPTANSCNGRGSGNYKPWVEYNTIDELKIVINSNAPIKRISNSDYSINGNYTTISGFSGGGFTPTIDSFYDSTQKTYTFLNSLVELRIDLGNSSNTGYIELYQTSSGGLGIPQRIEQLSFLNANSDGPSPSGYSGHDIGVIGTGDEISGDQREFFYTGSLFSGLNVASQVGGPIIIPPSSVSLSGALIGLSGSTVSLSTGVFGLPTSTLNFGPNATVSLSGSTVSLNGNSVSLTNSNILSGNKLGFGNASSFSITSGTTLTTTPINLNGSTAYLSGSFGSSTNSGNLNGDIISINNSSIGLGSNILTFSNPISLSGDNVSLSGSIFNSAGSTAGSGNLLLGGDSLVTLSKNITSAGTVSTIESGMFSLSGSVITGNIGFFGPNGSTIGGSSTIILGNTSNIIINGSPVTLDNSIIYLSGSTIGGTTNIFLGKDSYIDINNSILDTNLNKTLSGGINFSTNSNYSVTKNITLTGTTYNINSNTISLDGATLSGLNTNLYGGIGSLKDSKMMDFETAGGYRVTQGSYNRNGSQANGGLYGMQSGNYHNNNSRACFEINETVNSDFKFSFWKKIESELNYDYLGFYINGSLVSDSYLAGAISNNKPYDWSGIVPWTKASYDLTAGKYNFEWCYEKDAFVHDGLDRARIDDIKIERQFFDEILLGSGSSVIIAGVPTSLSGSTINIDNEAITGADSILLGSGSKINLTSQLINSNNKVNGTAPSITLKGGYIDLGSNSITTISGNSYLGYGDLTLARRQFAREEKGYIGSSVNSYDTYWPEPVGPGSKSKNIEVTPGSVDGCDTYSTVAAIGLGNRCTKDVNKAFRYSSKQNVDLKLYRKNLDCKIDHYNTPGIINSSTTPIVPIIGLPSVINSSVITPPSNYFSFSGGYIAGVYAGSTINGGGFDYLGRMIVEATDGNYHIEGINYVNAFNSTGTLEKIVGQITVDGDLMDVIGDSSTPTGSFINQGVGSHDINDLVQDRNFNIETTVRGNYEFNLQFFDKTASGDLIEIDSIDFPLTIVPTNNMEVIGNGTVSYPSGIPHSNADQMFDHSDVAEICYNLQDEFENPIGYKGYGGPDKYTAINNGTSYNSMRVSGFGDYQTGNGRTLSGVYVSFPTMNSHLLSSASIVNGISLNQRTGFGEAIEIRDMSGLGNSGPYDNTSPGYVYTGPSDTKHLVTFKGSRVCFNIQSYAPSNKPLRFQLTVPTHNIDYDMTPNGGTGVLTNNSTTANVRFDKPFYGNLSIDDDGEFKVGTEQTMRIDVVKNDGECSSSICDSNFTISNYLNSFTSMNGFYSVLRKDTEINTAGTVSPLSLPTPWMVPLTTNRTKLDFVLNYVSGDTITSHPTYGVRANLWITNNVNGQNVTYRLNSSEQGGLNTWINQDETAFYGVNADGSIQGESTTSNNDTSSTVTGQQATFTNIDKLEMRKQIKSNAYDLIRNRTSATTYNGVNYIEGDYTINGNGTPGNGNQAYETLIIKNGNLTISGSGRVITNNLGIIVIKDDLADKSLGNIFITPDVTEITAMIYTDGSLLSKPNAGYYTDDGLITGNPEDTPTRTRELQKQLIMNGSLFSRNTIGGAIGTSPFTCPGGSNCSSFDEAVKYDLNYLRRGFDGWDRNGNTILDAGEYQNVGFVVDYNPQNQINPPKGFENNK